MSERPKKREKKIHFNAKNSVWVAGYNSACDAWEKWLPSEEELRSIIEHLCLMADRGRDVQIKWPGGLKKFYSDLASAIHKRLLGKSK